MGPSTQPTASEKFCTALSEAECDKDVRCGYMDAEDRPVCVADRDLDCVELSIVTARGGAAFDSAKATACVEGIRTKVCGHSDPAECDAVFSARGQVGSSCTADTCNSGAFCASAPAGCGTCQSTVASGQRCVAGDRCAAASDCQPPVGGFTAGAGTCLPVKADATACTSSSECSSGICRTVAVGQKVCGGIARGAACSTVGTCKSEDYCKGLKRTAVADGGVTVVNGLCAARLAAGPVLCDRRARQHRRLRRGVDLLQQDLSDSARRAPRWVRTAWTVRVHRGPLL